MPIPRDPLVVFDGLCTLAKGTRCNSAFLKLSKDVSGLTLVGAWVRTANVIPINPLKQTRKKKVTNGTT